MSGTARPKSAKASKAKSATPGKTHIQKTTPKTSPDQQHKFSDYQQMLYDDQLKRDAETIASLKEQIRQLTDQNANGKSQKSDEDAVLKQNKMLTEKNEELTNQVKVLKEQLHLATSVNPEKLAEENKELMETISSMKKNISKIVSTKREPAESLQVKVKELEKELQELEKEREKTQLQHEESIRTIKRQHASAINNEKEISSNLREKMSDLNDKLLKIGTEKSLQMTDDTVGRIERTQTSDQMPEHASDNSRKKEEAVSERAGGTADENGMKDNQETGEQKSIPQMEGLIQSVRTSEASLLKDRNTLRDQKKQLLQDLEKKANVIKEQEEELGKLRTLMSGDQEPLEGETESMVKELKQLHKRNEEASEKATTLETNAAKLRTELSSKDKEIEKLKTTVQKLKTEKEEKARILSEIQIDSGKYTKLESKVNTLQDQLSLKTKENDALQQKMNLQKEKEQIGSKVRDEIARLERNNEKLKKELSLTSGSQSEQVRKLKEEMENLKNRLSQASASQLLNNNPNIADLSDSNRATKLAEKYTELYDNEWTDAFEEETDSGNKTEKEAIKDLYDTLKGAYDHCTKTFTEYSKGAKKSLIYFRGQEGQYDKLPAVVDKQIKDTLKSFAPALTEKITESFMSEKSIQNCPTKNTYMRKCIELCWLMAIQDPPVVLTTENPTEFNVDLYKAYTKSGKQVDYVVMPPLHLHKGGALLAKGTAQGKL